MWEKDLEDPKPTTGIVTALEFQGRTTILRVRPDALVQIKVRLGAWLYRKGQKLMGIKIGKGVLLFQSGEKIEL